MDRQSLERRARLFSSIRQFFSQRQVLEVDVPLLGATTVTDPYINAVSASVAGQTAYLQTSPEYFMKRMLAAGSGSIYYLGKAVRDDESSPRHNPEFTLLEWYREGFNDRDLMDEVLAFIAEVARGSAPEAGGAKRSYREVFVQGVGLDPHAATDQELVAALAKETTWVGASPDRSTCLEVLFSYCVEPTLQEPTLVFDYPACQCALAKIADDEQGVSVAKRFELFWRGIELANGYWELTDPEQQLARFEADRALRKTEGRFVPDIDDKFLNALRSGLPECAGVALGVDRLLMCIEHADSILDVIPFAWEQL